MRPKRPQQQAEYMTAPDHSWKRRIPLAPRAPSIHDPHQKSVVQCNGFRLMCRNASRGIADHREAVVAQRNLGSAQAWMWRDSRDAPCDPRRSPTIHGIAGVNFAGISLRWRLRRGSSGGARWHWERAKCGYKCPGCSDNASGFLLMGCASHFQQNSITRSAGATDGRN